MAGTTAEHPGAAPTQGAIAPRARASDGALPRHGAAGVRLAPVVGLPGARVHGLRPARGQGHRRLRERPRGRAVDTFVGAVLGVPLALQIFHPAAVHLDEDADPPIPRHPALVHFLEGLDERLVVLVIACGPEKLAIEEGMGLDAGCAHLAEQLAHLPQRMRRGHARGEGGVGHDVRHDAPGAHVRPSLPSSILGVPARGDQARIVPYVRRDLTLAHHGEELLRPCRVAVPAARPQCGAKLDLRELQAGRLHLRQYPHHPNGIARAAICGHGTREAGGVERNSAGPHLLHELLDLMQVTRAGEHHEHQVVGSRVLVAQVPERLPSLRGLEGAGACAQHREADSLADLIPLTAVVGDDSDRLLPFARGA
mmetsp:Transcript_57244/g.158431  ORF Transcript_57244/g.158431 Transcript_57244/m.158431 type:complete len:368 (-) Transcript_57244:48-1151(-)